MDIDSPDPNNPSNYNITNQQHVHPLPFTSGVIPGFNPYLNSSLNIWIVVYSRTREQYIQNSQSNLTNTNSQSNLTGGIPNVNNSLIYGSHLFSNIIGCYSSFESANFQVNLNSSYQVLGPYPLVGYVPPFTQYRQ